MTPSCIAKLQSNSTPLRLEHTAQDPLLHCESTGHHPEGLQQVRCAACLHVQGSSGAAAGAASQRPPAVAITPLAPGWSPDLQGSAGAATGAAPQEQPPEALVTPLAPGWHGGGARAGDGPRAGGPRERNGAPTASVSGLPAKRVLSDPVMHTGIPFLQWVQEKNTLLHQSVIVNPAGQLMLSMA